MSLDASVIEAGEAVTARAPVARFVGPGYVAAFVAVTLAGFAQAGATPGVLEARGAMLAVAAAAAAYAVLGTLGVHVAERHGSRRRVQVVIGALAALGGATTLATRGYASMLLLAVVSVGVLHLGRRASVALATAAALVALIAFAARGSLWAALVQAEIAFGSGIAFVFVFSRIALREHRARIANERLVAALAEAHARVTAQTRQAEELARAEERNRIAREIHDGLGHYLTVVHVQLEAARSYLTSEPERARGALDRAQQLTRDGLGEVRRSVALLRGSAPARPPLLEALGALVEDSTVAGLAVRLRVEGTPRRLAEPIEFTLYRVAQEALSNARRHARASHVAVALAFTGAGSVRIRIEDDGVGASPPPEGADRTNGADRADAAGGAGSGGFGLRGMRERAEIAGGTLAVTTGPGQGFAVELEVPG